MRPGASRAVPAPREAEPAPSSEAPSASTTIFAAVISELRHVVPLGFQQSVIKMCNFVPRLILMMMVGRLQDGPMLLSGVGMGSMYNNICGQSFIIATSFGDLYFESWSFSSLLAFSFIIISTVGYLLLYFSDRKVGLENGILFKSFCSSSRD